MTHRNERQITGVTVSVAGRAWAAGVFAVGNPWWTGLVLSLPVLLVIGLSLGVLREGDVRDEGPRGGWAIGLHLYSAVSLVLAVASIIAGQTGIGSQFFGVKSGVEIVPTVIIGLGAAIWLTTLSMFSKAGRTVEARAR
ncbi:MAG: hypothetical protein ACRDHE_12830 [Ktedonobacterales bacterium]